MENTLSATDKTLSVTENTLSAADKTLSVMENTLSATDKTLSAMEKPFSVRVQPECLPHRLLSAAVLSTAPGNNPPSTDAPVSWHQETRRRTHRQAGAGWDAPIFGMTSKKAAAAKTKMPAA